jgi:hypothetical protein
VVPRLARDDVAVREFTLESQRIRPPAIVMQQRPSASTARMVVFASSCPFKYAIATSAPSRIQDRARVCIARMLPPMRHCFRRQT